MRLVVATRNPHKLAELSALLAPHELAALPEEVTLPPESGTTYAQNASEKARTTACATGAAAIADDSGIEAAALHGGPGPRSARYAGEGATDEQNLARLIREVGASGDRSVAYVCVLAFSTAVGHVTCFRARCQGTLALEPRGTGGFGYDPAFLPLEVSDGRTMAELSAAEKAAISHRGRAARALLRWLEGREAAE